MKQGYFFLLRDQLAMWILDEAGRVETAHDDLVDPEDFPAGQKGRTVITRRPDGKREVKTRGEHSQLVRHLFHGRTERECDLCGRTFPIDLLVTAHIKQRAKANAAQRIDPHIVMAACSLGCDELYERGYVYVDQSGTLKSDMRGRSAALDAALAELIERKISIFSEGTRTYFAWHRNNKRRKKAKAIIGRPALVP